MTVTLSVDQLSETDKEVLDVLHSGRTTPQYLANQIGLSRPYASQVLKRLVEHDHVDRIAPGLYELADDPRVDVTETLPADALERQVRRLESELEACHDALEAAQADELDVDATTVMKAARAARSALSCRPPDVATADAEIEAITTALGE